jgi:hypothetical protein
MSNGPRASKDVNYLFPLAEKELSAFVHAVDQLFGSEAQRSALDWIHEMDVMNWPVGDAMPNWRQATIRASTQLYSSHSPAGKNDADKKAETSPYCRGG